MSSSSTHGLTAIVAATKSNGIGLNGSLPWRLPGEMKYFAKVTTTMPSSSKTPNAVIMGRKTWESIPTKFRPLKDRQNLVISRQGLDLGGAAESSTHTSLEAALAAVAPESRVFLIGGSQLYNLSFEADPPFVDRVLLTRVLTDFECDTFLHDFTAETSRWQKRSHEELCEWIGFQVDEENEEKGVRYRYEMWTIKS